MKVQNLMSAPVISVKIDTVLAEIVHLINSHQINHVPVIDANERVIGMIGSHELFPKAKIFRSSDVRIPTLFKQIVDVKHIVASYKEATQVVAEDIMSPPPVCVDVNDDVNHVIWQMAEKNLQTIPVVRDEKLVGIVTRRDFLRLLAQGL